MANIYRDIEFRGKREDNNEWVYGFYWCIEEHITPSLSNRYFIKSYNNGIDYEVTSETVGQFTGKTDKTGKEIYKDDIVASLDGLCLVRWDEKRFMFVLHYYDYPDEELCLEELWDDCWILGNLYDNLDLLGEQNERE